MTRSDRAQWLARRPDRIAGRRAGAATTAAAAAIAAILLAGDALAQPPGAWRHAGPFGPPGVPDAGERQRHRQELREQLRDERMRHADAPPGDPGRRDRLSPDERQALRRQLREQAVQGPGR